MSFCMCYIPGLMSWWQFLRSRFYSALNFLCIFFHLCLDYPFHTLPSPETHHLLVTTQISNIPDKSRGGWEEVVGPRCTRSCQAVDIFPWLNTRAYFSKLSTAQESDKFLILQRREVAGSVSLTLVPPWSRRRYDPQGMRTGGSNRPLAETPVI